MPLNVFLPELRVNATTSGIQDDARVAALLDGGFVVVWESGSSIQARRYDSSGGLIGSTFVPSSQGLDPTVAALPNGGFIIGWDRGTSAFSRSYSAAGVGGATDAHPQVENVSLFALAGGAAMVGENQQTTGLWRLAYGPAGAITLGERIASTVGELDDPDGVLLSDGRVIIVSQRDGNSIRGLFASGTDLAPIGADFVVNTTTLDSPATTIRDGPNGQPRVAAREGGGFMVVWEHVAGGSVDIRGRVFNAAGAAVGDDFLVNTQAVGDQRNGEVLALKDGTYLVLWGDATSQSVEGQRFSADGAPIEAQFRVSSLPANATDSNEVHGAVLNNGLVAVTWRVDGQLGDADGGVAMVILDPRSGFLVGADDGPNTLDGTAGEDRIFGLGGDDTLNGLGGPDLMNGGAGADTLNGGVGADRLIGGLGADLFVIASAADSPTSASDSIADFETGVDKIDVRALGANARLTLAALGSNNFVYVDADGNGTQDAAVIVSDRAVGGDDVLLASAATGVSVFGDATSNTLTGSRFRDVFSGGDGADTMTGGAGGDRFYGQGGADTYVLRPGDSTMADFDVAFDFTSGSDKIDVSALAAAGAKLTLARSGSGGSGSAGFLYIDENGDGTNDGVFISSSNFIPIIEGSDLIGTTNGSLSILGTAQPEELTGTTAGDTIAGFAGTDIIEGDSGGDFLYGGADADQFYYAGFGDSTMTAFDYIQDFVSGVDKIDLWFLEFIEGAQVRTSTFDGSTFVYVFVDEFGDGDYVQQDFAIVLSGVTSVQASDFYTARRDAPVDPSAAPVVCIGPTDGDLGWMI